MKKILSKLQQQRGQVIIMFVGIFTIIAVIGVITVDFGLWFSERRGAQTDADLPALAGAYECMLELASGGAYSGDPQGAVQDWFDLNNEGNAALEGVDVNCPCVTVDVRHQSRSLFASIFDRVAPDIGARAKACAGAAVAPENAVPFEVAKQDLCFVAGQPQFGEVCPLEGGSHGKCPPDDTECQSNPRGILDLVTKEQGYCSDQQGSADPADVIPCGAAGMCLINEEGAQGTCPGGEWYDCADVQDGNMSDVLNGVQCRLQGGSSPSCHKASCDPPGEGLCDGPDSNTTDDFDESVTLLVDSQDLSERVYEAKDCDPDTDGVQISPRLITIIVFDVIPGANETLPITAFAGFYLEGCAPQDFDPDGDPYTPPTVEELEAWFEDQGNDEDKYRQCDVGNPGQQTVYGRFVNLIVSGSGIGPVDPSSTTFSIALVDWEGGGGTPGPTAVPTPTRVPTVAPTATPVPTVAPTATPVPPPTPCPTQCNPQGKNCKPNCP